MWVRGLKLIMSNKKLSSIKVAPYVGAWIETPVRSRYSPYSFVAPYVGAWIETCVTQACSLKHLSHPMWVRGLKQM